MAQKSKKKEDDAKKRGGCKFLLRQASHRAER